MRIYLLFFVLLFGSCQSIGQQSSPAVLSPKAFSAKISSGTNVQLLDVRTPQEFAGGHIQGAVNADWNGNDFEQQVSGLDRTKPVYVYCMSGGRSAAAAEKLRDMGFNDVQELDGGMLAWRAEKLPEADKSSGTAQAAPTPASQKLRDLTAAQFQSHLMSDKLVLVDFYADWCGPCKKMAPFIDQIGEEMKDQVVILRIDADANDQLAAEMGIRGLPTIQLYKNKKQVWQQLGFMDKATLEGAIKSQL